MSNGFFKAPAPRNEEIQSYEPNSPEYLALKDELSRQLTSIVDIPMVIGKDRVFTDQKNKITCPHDREKVIATTQQASHEQL